MNGTVLVVEDDAALREVYGEMLTDEGWNVHLAADGLEALDALERGIEPCVVIVDLRMPRMDGWSLIRWLQSSEWHELPYVVVAAHYQLETEAERMGVRWWLQKPIDVERMLEIVTEACESATAA